MQSRPIFMSKDNTRYLTMSYATSFIAGFCVMVVEIIAGKLIARYLGASLYTWTSVIGVVLAGISFGNYMGGKIADRFSPRKTLSALFILASLACVLVPVVNNLLGYHAFTLRFTWPLNIVAHVGLTFFLPSCLLGIISPVVAKFALDQGFKTGRTIGNIYAWGALGSILGTFITGFFLISAMGSVAIIWTVAGILMLVGMLYSSRSFFARIWVGAFIFLCLISFAPLTWASRMASSLFLTDSEKGSVVYAKDSPYAYISVSRDKLNPRILNFTLDNLIQTKINVDDALNLNYSYKCHNLFVSIVENLRPLKEDPAILNLGGGGYIVPRYIKNRLPKSRVEVVEIDPEVTKAAVYAFGLPEDSGIIIHHMDARNYIKQAVTRKNRGEDIYLFDFILSDVLGSVAVPYQLTTREYNEKIARLLAPEGVYAINLIDSKESPRFLLAMLNTLDRTFNNVYVFATERETDLTACGYGTYIIVSSKKAIDRAKLDLIKEDGRLLDKETIRSLGDKLKVGIVLTDDHAPVDNLLRETFRAKGEFLRCAKMIDKGVEFLEAKKTDKALEQFENALRVNPNIPFAYNNIAAVKARKGQYEEAIGYYQKALSLEPDFLQAMIGLGNAMERFGRRKEAIEIFYEIIRIEPNLAGVYASLGNALFAEGRIEEAVENYRKALELEPTMESARRNLDVALRVKAENMTEDKKND